MEFTTDQLNEYSARIVYLFKRWQFGTKHQVAFLEDLYLLINDGIPANRAVEMMTQVTGGLSKEVAASVSAKIAEGQPLADGMKEWFSQNVVEIIRVGEAGGALAQTLKSAINMLSQRGAATGSLIGAVAYPLLVIVMGCVVIVYLNKSVFTQFALIKPMSQWPDAGKQLVALSGFIQRYWWLTLVALVCGFFALRHLMTNYVGSLRPSLDRVPPFSFYRQFTSARLLETLGLLVANGVVFKAAIKVMQHQANPYLASHLMMMEHLLSTGKTNIAEVLATGLVDPDDLMRLRIMAEVKGFEHGLVRMGIRGTENASATIKLIARVTGGILLIIGGILILMMVRGIFMTGMAMGTI